MATRSTTTATTKAKPAKAKTTTKTAAAKAVATSAPKATIVETVTPIVSGLPIKKPELIDRVVTETGMKKKDVKPVVEAMLSVLARTLSEGEEITAPPMGKLMIKRVKDLPNAKVLTLKMRIPTGEKGPKPDPLAQAAE
ncbi:HU family DNA-binding protein [Octadecabacter sp. G9-8]|uniref:HU family DNA-binding protein n=1 Tax=Octadecabacter dasysiphoniae TaxID=2909341 RepID=A0ABS9CZX2_9RHOB|nr:HU family DNA-binding protein [Octadecabacter dasysiphoniae]MCF2872728.1 HU family DNA-binding protein [Octadecabacter dasysiphoniae]